MSTTLADTIRDDFPILQTQMSGKPLVYLDNGATTQKPQAVIDAIVDYYSRHNANIHRGMYELSQRSTDLVEAARQKVARFLNAPHAAECIFVRGTTEGINLVASSWGKTFLGPDDEIIVTGMEHHSNIVPWQLACEAAGARLKVLYADAEGHLDPDQLSELLSERTKLVAIQHVSNALGTIHDVAAIAERTKRVGGLVLVDGAQWVGHHPTDVQQLGCDFYVFSGHKLFGPTGIGVLWGRQEILRQMPPYQGGGDMIETVAFDSSTYADIPNRFEAGTPDMAGAVGLGAAIDYVINIGFERIDAYETELLRYATDQLQSVPGLRVVGTAEPKAAVISFVLEAPNIAPLDIATALSQDGIAVRTGHHCCMPLMGQLEVAGTCRVSLAMYNTFAEVDLLVSSLQALVAARSQRSRAASSTERAEQPLQFAAATADSVASAADKLSEEFLEFDDRESKTELLMELGQQLPDHFDVLKSLTSPVPGCMSEVYLVGRPQADQAEKVEFAADSNAEIVRGLIAVLQQLYSGQPASQIVEFDIESFFRRIGLDQFVSTQRRSGLDGMIRRIRSLAETVAS